MIDRDLFLPYRLFVVRVGLVLSWVGTLGFIWLANRGPGPRMEASADEIAVFVAMVVLLSLAPWRTALRGEIGDAYIGVWCVVAVGGIIAAHGMAAGPPMSVAFIVVVVYGAATLIRTGYLAVVATSALIAYAIALDRAGTELFHGQGRLGLIAFAIAELFSIAASVGVARVFAVAARRLVELEEISADLERRRMEIDELYSISATIGLGGTLAEIVPVMMSRIVAAMGARVGLVFLFRPEHDDLELISPLWVAGRPVLVDAYTLPLTHGGAVQRVFTSGEPLASNEPLSKRNGDPLLDDLDTSCVAGVSMSVDARPIGVLVVADKPDGEFTPEDIGRLQSLAGPAALVMNQMARYDAAQETSQKMTELAQLKSDFVSVVSHELRSPITSIIGSLRTLLRPEIEPGSATAQDLVESAARQADRLRGLIEDLLVASRLDSDALPVRPQTTRIEEVISDIVSEIPVPEDRLHLRVAPNLRDILVDPAHLRRIVRNLVENAVKYAEGSDIEIEVQQGAEHVSIAVIDHGPGIPYELHEHIFQPFTQAQHHETRARGGTGLGLSIVRGLAETMGGIVWYEPTIGGGATFKVSLPLRSGARRQHA